MRMFRKRPVVIEAIQWTGENFDELFDWGSPHGGILNAKILRDGDGHNTTKLSITTLEGVMTAEVDDWIIKGIEGELYPCKPDIFEATYEPVVATLTQDKSEHGYA